MEFGIRRRWFKAEFGRVHRSFSLQEHNVSAAKCKDRTSRRRVCVKHAQFETCNVLSKGSKRQNVSDIPATMLDNPVNFEEAKVAEKDLQYLRALKQF